MGVVGRVCGARLAALLVQRQRVCRGLRHCDECKLGCMPALCGIEVANGATYGHGVCSPGTKVHCMESVCM